jgi:hypothetical protein
MGMELPHNVVAKRTSISPTSFAYTFSHRELGELGSVLFCAGHAGGCHLTHQLQGKANDVLTERRRALFEPIVQTMMEQLFEAGRPTGPV